MLLDLGASSEELEAAIGRDGYMRRTALRKPRRVDRHRGRAGFLSPRRGDQGRRHDEAQLRAPVFKRMREAPPLGVGTRKWFALGSPSCGPFRNFPGFRQIDLLTHMEEPAEVSVIAA